MAEGERGLWGLGKGMCPLLVQEPKEMADPQGRWLCDVPEEMGIHALGFSALEAASVPQAWVGQPSSGQCVCE